MLGRVTSTPSGTRSSCLEIIMLPAGSRSPVVAATVCTSHGIAPGRCLPACLAKLLPSARPALADNGGGGPGPAVQRHPVPGLVVPRRVNDDPRLGHVQHLELAHGQVQR